MCLGKKATFYDISKTSNNNSNAYTHTTLNTQAQCRDLFIVLILHSKTFTNKREESEDSEGFRRLKKNMMLEKEFTKAVEREKVTAAHSALGKALMQPMYARLLHDRKGQCLKTAVQF